MAVLPIPTQRRVGCRPCNKPPPNRLFRAPSCSATRRGRRRSSRRTANGCPGWRRRTACSTSGWRRSATWTRRASSPTTASAASASMVGRRTARMCSTSRTRAATRTSTRFAIEVATREVRNLTPIKGVQAQMHGFSLDFPDTIAVGLNERDKSWHDLFLIDIRSGKRELLFENKDQLSRIVLDRQFKPRLASKTRAKEGGRTRYRIEDGKLDRDRRGRARGRSHDLHDRLHARRRHALQRVVDRPRQGGAVRHRYGDGQGACAGRASQGRCRPRALSSRDGRDRCRRCRIPAPRLDTARGGDGLRSQVSARRAARARSALPTGRSTTSIGSSPPAPPRRRPPTTCTTATNRPCASCSAHAPSSRATPLRPCTARSFAHAMVWSCRPISPSRTASGPGRPSRCPWCWRCMAARGRATPTASTRRRSGWPIAALPCCR